MEIKSLKFQAQQEIQNTKTLKELDEIFRKYLGKKGKITQLFRSLKELPEKERKKIGKQANQIKKEIELTLQIKKEKLEVSSHRFQKEFDITVPGKKPLIGHLHPITLVVRKVEEIFQNMGFSIAEGPEVETEWYNFDALNIPKNHPARDIWDTLWLQDDYKLKVQGSKFKVEKLLLRTHTSPVQIRYMEKNQPPLRIIAPGQVFRHEATDSAHELQFHQLEGLMIDKEVSLINCKAVLENFFKEFFGKEIHIRMRPSYFPFTEPSFEMDIRRNNSEPWMEMLGAGMVHPNVLKNSGLNPKNWQGFAFGIGIDRLTMIKYKINDIRLFHSGDLRFLQQF